MGIAHYNEDYPMQVDGWKSTQHSKAYVGTCMKTGVLCNLIAIALLVYVLAVCISIHNIIHYNIWSYV